MHVGEPANRGDLVVRTNSRYTCVMVIVHVENTHVLDALYTEI